MAFLADLRLLLVCSSFCQHILTYPTAYFCSSWFRFPKKAKQGLAAVPTAMVKPKWRLGVFLPLLGAYLKGLLGSAITFVFRCCL